MWSDHCLENTAAALNNKVAKLALFKKARTDAQTVQESNNEPVEIECEIDTMFTSAMVSINISHHSMMWLSSLPLVTLLQV